MPRILHFNVYFLMSNQLTLRDRTFKSRTPSQTVRVVSDCRPPLYKEYHQEKLCRAYEEVKDGRLSIRRAAEQYGIPKSTLADRISGRVKFGAHSGPPRYLSDSEEKELASFICQSARIGYARTKKEILAVVEAVLASKSNCGGTIQLSNGWWESFRKRHPYLTLRSIEKLSYARFLATDDVVINHYFDLLEQTLEDNDLLEKPSLIYNCDETGLPLNHTPSAVVGVRGQKHPRIITSGRKQQITVLCCTNAAGNTIPPLVIFSRKALNPSLTVSEVPGTMYGLNESGWIDSEIFFNWFAHHFLTHAPSSRPLLLLLDGHSTHYNPAFVRRAAEEKVIVFCLPPNTTHLTQPLDKGVFGPLKTYWHQECQVFMGQNPGQVVTQYNFNALFNRAWCRSMTIPNITAAFRTTGVYPFNRRAVKLADDTPQLSPFLCEETGLAFIPLYSPARRKRNVDFTEEEVSRFARRYEEGYNITTDHRYNLWLREHEGVFKEDSSGVPSNLLLADGSSRESVLKKITQLPKPPPIRSQKSEHKCGRVLTSVENRRAIEEKEKVKQQKLKEKERRNEERLRKRAEKEKKKCRIGQASRRTTIKGSSYSTIIVIG